MSISWLNFNSVTKKDKYNFIEDFIENNWQRYLWRCKWRCWNAKNILIWCWNKCKIHSKLSDKQKDILRWKLKFLINNYSFLSKKSLENFLFMNEINSNIDYVFENKNSKLVKSKIPFEL